MANADPAAILRQRLTAEALASRLPALLVAAQRVADTVAQGVHGRRRTGPGESFWQFRRYMAGDPVERIDWRQTAKTDAVYVRETEWESAQTVWLWRDASPSMAWASRPEFPEKKARAELLLMALVSLLARGGERVGLLAEGARAVHGRFAVNRLGEALVEEAGRSGDRPPTARLSRHAHAVLFGDFLGPLAETDAAIARLAGGGARGQMVQIADAAEENLPYVGRTRFQGLENEGEMLVARVESVRDEYRGVYANHVAGLREIARAHGWGYVAHRTDRPPETALLTLWLALGDASARAR